jgi:L-amino acid N-acyltransferase YncA
VNGVNGVDEVPVSPRGDIGGIDPEGNGSAVQPENRSVRYDPNFTAAQDKSLTNMNDGSESAARRKENNRMKENAKPGKADALSTPANNAQETQVQKLERLRTQEITKVGNRIRQQSGEPTTSPEALNLARQAGTKLQAAETTPEIRKTTTIELSPTIIAQMNGPGNGTAPLDVSEAQAKTQDSRRGPINRFGRSATLNTRGKRGGRSNNVRKSHWATASEVKPPQAPPKSIDSNAFGSEVPSDAETASGDSVAAMNNGRLLRKNRTDGPDAPLADWSGNWMPPPADWDGRPRFNNNSAEFIGEFGQWNEITALQSLNVATGIPFTRLSKDLVENPDLHPDGLDLVDPTISVDVDTAERYGYSEDAQLIIRRDAQLIDPEIFLQDWGKLDLRLPDNLKFKDERCEDLVRNYNANIAKEREEEISLRRAQKLARRREGPIISEPNPHTPRINIYLRPAVRSDIPQLQEIYNYYVKNSVRTAEIHPITYSEMLDRWADSTDEKLPFLVAVSKSAKINRDAGNAIEKVVGWASATDWVSRHAVERFTVELEIYVHQRHLHQGVGKCLMDKLIDSTDRGHIARKGYPFTCATEVRHGYSAGGARDLIKLLIIVRSFDKIRTPKENDLPWIKKWLEDEWKFEQQGYFPKAGVKFKR